MGGADFWDEAVVKTLGNGAHTPGIRAGLTGEGPVQHAGQTGDGVASAEAIAERQAAARRVVVGFVRDADHRVVLVVVVVIQDDPAG